MDINPILAVGKVVERLDDAAVIGQIGCAAEILASHALLRLGIAQARLALLSTCAKESATLGIALFPCHNRCVLE